jgi:hypothetical protein
MGAYVWGRAASLGRDVEPSVVASAFGVFEPELIAASLARAQQVVSRDEILGLRQAGADAGLAMATSGIDTALIEFLAARLLNALVPCAGTARPMFCALRSLAIPVSPHGALWRAAEMFREHRGDGHLAACVAAGLEPVEMNVLTELWLNFKVGEYSGTRGFSAGATESAVARLSERGWVQGYELTYSGRQARAAIETATDLSQATVIEGLGDDVEAVISAATAIGNAVVSAHAAPADPRKRAAG